MVSYEEYQALKNSIHMVLDETVERLSGSLPAQSKNEPLNNLNNRILSEPAQQSEKTGQGQKNNGR